MSDELGHARSLADQLRLAVKNGNLPNELADERDHEEEVLSTNPFEGRFTFTVDGDRITLTVDEELDVLNVETGEDLVSQSPMAHPWLSRDLRT